MNEVPDEPARAAAPDARRLAELIVLLARMTRGDEFSGGLNPVQWAALRYFARANRFSRTVSCLARHQGTTQGTASQTVKSLVAKGMLERRRSSRDRRVVELVLTPLARERIAEDPLEELAGLVARIPESTRRVVDTALTEVLTCALERMARPRFGPCRECCHLREGVGPGAGEGETGSAVREPEGCRCGLLDERLEWRELDHICVNFRAAREDTALGAVAGGAGASPPQPPGPEAT